jgi:enterochelin esterase-like enzyme
VKRYITRAPSLENDQRKLHVYLPPGYDDPDSAARRYPVVILLHGWPGSDGDWFSRGQAGAIADTMIANGEIPPVILVCPNGNGHGFRNRTIYMNAWNGKRRMEDYVAIDVVAWMDSTFRTRTEPRDRAVVGLSDGAVGAFNLLFHHPDTFGGAGGHSGGYLLEHTFDTGTVLGHEPFRSRLLAEYSPSLTARSAAPKLAGATLYFDCGTRDSDYPKNVAFDDTLTALGIPHTFHGYPGSHTWGYWREHLHESLRAVTAPMR